MSNTIHIDLREKRGSAKDHALELEERKILESTLTKKNKIIYILGAYAGLRCEEIAQTRFSWLKWLELENKKVLAINIPAKDRDLRNPLKLFQTKKRDSRTTYIFNDEYAVYLYTWLESNERGLLMSRQSIHKRVAKWNALINRQENKLHPHALRSTAQNIYKFEYGFDDIFIQLCFGWKDMNTMLKHYRTMNKASGESYLINQIINKK